ncbi:hypothetical protein Anapl_11001 [Anas platyrhynchos]|uniref:Uncharacterized protein n=1 Tax=Anas platyrhynchos TaxID=8839 RepID=R0L223_ANAPL|nr:hypothetical protein Anapl_11001 [Anas platyrhynchos]
MGFSLAVVFGRPATLDRYTMVVRDLRSLLLFPGYEKNAPELGLWWGKSGHEPLCRSSVALLGVLRGVSWGWPELELHGAALCSPPPEGNGWQTSFAYGNIEKTTGTSNFTNISEIHEQPKCHELYLGGTGDPRKLTHL